MITKIKRYHTKFVSYGEFVDVYNYKKPIFYNFPSREKKIAPLRGNDKERLRRTFSIERARATLYRLVKANEAGLNLFLTLTFKQNIGSLLEANVLFSNFQKRVKYFIGQNIKYVAVPEFQKRGAVHYHVVIFDFPRSKRRNLREHFENFWEHGFVHLKNINHVRNVGAYIAKYIQKDTFDKRLVGYKAYFASRNLQRPIIVRHKSLSLDSYLLLKEKTYISKNNLITLKYYGKQKNRRHNS